LPGNADYSTTAASFSAGAVRTDTTNNVVTAANDQLVEATLESFPGQVLSGLSTATQAPAASGSQQIDVTDNDTYTVSIAGGTTAVTEGGSSQNVAVTLTLTANGVSLDSFPTRRSSDLLPGNADYSTTAA